MGKLEGRVALITGAARGQGEAEARLFAAEGARGGPFTPDSATFTVVNNLDIELVYEVTADASWLDVTGADGFIPAGGEDEITVSLNSAANAFANGHYEASVSFVNLTDHDTHDVRPNCEDNWMRDPRTGHTPAAPAHCYLSGRTSGDPRVPVL